MRRVEFVVAGSPNEAFFSQIAANRKSVFAQTWTRWQPSYRCIFGGTPDAAAMSIWMPLLSDIDVEFLSSERFERDGYFAQSERRTTPNGDDFDVSVLLDADSLVTGDLEEVLDQVHEARTIAGVQAHEGFPTGDGSTRSTTADWQSLAEKVLGKTIRLPYTYSMAPEQAAEDQRVAPFYINAGAIFISKAIRSALADTYLALRPQVAPHLLRPYFSGQVAITLAVEDLGLDPISLPMRYNFPNDPQADAMHPDELADVRLIHFLRYSKFNRNEIFATEPAYKEFLEQPLEGSNKVFQDRVREILGETYPFGDRMDRIWKVISGLRKNNDIRVVNKFSDDDRRSRLVEQREKLKERNARIKKLEGALARDRKSLETALETTKEMQSRINELHTRLQALTADRESLQVEHDAALASLAVSKRRIAELEQSVEAMTAVLEDIRSANIWRLFAAVRSARTSFRDP